MRFLFDLAYLVAGLLVSPVALYRACRHSRYRKGWHNRLGTIDRKDTSKKCIWLHAVSVGEINAARTVIEQLRNQFPDHEVVISATTDTGFARAEKLFAGRHTVFYFPLDFSWAMTRAFNRIRPSLCLLMELEIWPNFMHVASSRNVPVIVVNGRISNKGFSRYRLIKPIARMVFGRVRLVLAQTEEYARRFCALGCPDNRVIVTGSLKYDTAEIADKIEGTDKLIEQIELTQEPLWVAGGTGPGEEELLLNVYRNLIRDESFANLRLAVVPRKPERFNEVAQLIESRQFALVRYSAVKAGRHATPIDKRAVLLGDTMGDLRKFYSVATIVFVGRSLVPMGGSDMMEAAALGKCTMFGPHTFNFEQTVEQLLADDGAIRVRDEEELLHAVRRCLSEPQSAGRIAEKGQEVIRKNQGATQRCLDAIMGVIENTERTNETSA